VRTAPVPFRGAQDAVARARDHAVAIPPAPTADIDLRNDYSTSDHRVAGGGFGVFVSPIYVLTHAAALDGRSSLTVIAASGQSIDATVAAYEPSTGLVLLRIAAADRPLPTLAAALPETGALAAGIARAGGRDIAIPVFVTSVASDRFFVGGVQTAAPGLPI
jgi:S1-C subfamily serine protease